MTRRYLIDVINAWHQYGLTLETLIISATLVNVIVAPFFYSLHVDVLSILHSPGMSYTKKYLDMSVRWESGVSSCMRKS
jgi:hypothetical protein